MSSAADTPAKPGSLLRLLWRSHPWLTLFTVLTGVISGVASIAVVNVINTAIHDDAARSTALYWFVGLSVVALLFRNGAALFPALASRRIMTHLRIALCRKILVTPLEEVDRRGAANVLTMLTTDIPQLSTTLVVIPTVLVEATVFVFGIGYLAYLSWVVLAFTLGLMLLGVVLYFFCFGKGIGVSSRMRDEYTAFNEYTHALVFGLKELKLNRIRRNWFSRTAIEASSTRVAQLNFVERVWFTLGDNVGQLTLSLLIGCLLFVAPQLAVLEPSVLTASLLAVLYIMGPVSLLVGAMPVLAQGRVASTRLAQFGFSIDAHHGHTVEPDVPSLPAVAGSEGMPGISLQGVRVQYQGADASAGFALGPIDLQLVPGQLVYIVGGNGCGKSTLAKVLCGLYVPSDGQLKLGDQVVDEHNRSAYRDLFSAVFSDFQLFNRLIGPDENGACPDTAKQYLETLGLADKVQIQGHGYSTLKALSYGQQKRLALVCAYLEDRPVYVLDEWAADQDPPFKRFFYQELLPDLKRRGKTVLIITHDDQYFQLADRIIKLDSGRIVSDVDCTLQERQA
ncbi:cyclic peptide export ABC transporter [Pseudomonas sp. DTU_2021_1001937_2_SI_NGA_ILE_001]|uniref:cyclic peptide export ABC transporter n=1 Tax=Pseudomonas sp. DTU_2021_1001937_2_SI_NGA_ILE_001 TaxID=3077589 RepID=UPI0028FC0AF7|nr:cyclic peptide export ABC transporter [Pseudomonas sp. DTU_2021_1001937_2_SI_NGA_ILE_001]WNW10380.1 cyclic peptide export ABC transporter [Pseudomonas sp. DTU_2021_1001937_2_SI_NGA_ILE_001]